MTTHSILIGARGRGHIAMVQEAALASDQRYIVKLAVESIVLKPSTTIFDFFNSGELGSEPTVLLIEGIEDINNRSLDELIEELKSWTVYNPHIQTTIHWSLVGLQSWRVMELTEKLLPLVMLG